MICTDHYFHYSTPFLNPIHPTPRSRVGYYVAVGEYDGLCNLVLVLAWPLPEFGSKAARSIRLLCLLPSNTSTWVHGCR